MKAIFQYFLFSMLLFSGASVGGENTISIIGVGDIMLGTHHPSPRYLPRNNGRDLLAEVNEILKGADLTFGNLEGSILDSGATIKSCSKCYSFKMPERLIDNLQIAGFDVVSVANNHIRDFGQRGIRNTLRVLDQHGIETAGVDSKPTAIFTKNGVRYGFAAFAPNIGTVSINDHAGAKRIVSKLSREVDIVIVSFHGGAEGTGHMNVPRKNEYYYGENRGNVHGFAHAVIDAGADIVFGHGPHVPRAIEVYKDRFIAYSLGNFCTYGRFSVVGATGIAPIVKLDVSPDGSFVRGKIISAKQIKNRATVLDKSGGAVRVIRRLTRSDGFSGTVKISASGEIERIDERVIKD